MTTRLPRVTVAQTISALGKVGFSLARQTGSDKIYKNAAGQRVTVPFHAGKILHPKLLTSILADAALSVDDFIALL